MTNNTAGRIDPSAWDGDDDGEVTTPALYLTTRGIAAVDNYARTELDNAACIAGPHRALVFTHPNQLRTVEWDHIGEEPIGV